MQKNRALSPVRLRPLALYTPRSAAPSGTVHPRSPPATQLANRSLSPVHSHYILWQGKKKITI